MSPGRAEIAVHARRRGERPRSVAARVATEQGVVSGWRDERAVAVAVRLALLEGCGGRAREDGFGKEERLG